MVLSRRLPADLGGRKIYVTPDSALRYWHWNLEKTDPQLLGLVRTFVSPDSVVWDIGANVGLFSFPAASRARTVLAVEPDSWLSSLLVRSAAQIENVRVLTAAVSDSVGLAELNIAERGRSSNFISGSGSTQSGGTRFRQTVVSITLDWLAERFPLPDVLKIDVEGLEQNVLEGGQQLLQRAKPIIISEVLSQNSLATTELLNSADYELCDEHMRPVKRAYATTIAIPSKTTNRWLEKLQA
jgi:FkbM family methyltransferase